MKTVYKSLAVLVLLVLAACTSTQPGTINLSTDKWKKIQQGRDTFYVCARQCNPLVLVAYKAQPLSEKHEKQFFSTDGLSDEQLRQRISRGFGIVSSFSRGNISVSGPVTRSSYQTNRAIEFPIVLSKTGKSRDPGYIIMMAANGTNHMFVGISDSLSAASSGARSIVRAWRSQ